MSDAPNEKLRDPCKRGSDDMKTAPFGDLLAYAADLEARVAALEAALFAQLQIENGCLGYPECAGGFHAEKCPCAIEARAALEGK